jgi:hypothetical protein
MPALCILAANGRDGSWLCENVPAAGLARSDFSREAALVSFGPARAALLKGGSHNPLEKPKFARSSA